MLGVQKGSKIYVAGHRGMVGSAVVRKLQQEGFSNIIVRTHAELDLINQQAVRDFFAEEQPDYVVLAAAKVGGIHANNTYPAEFIYQNLMMECNVIHQAYSSGVKNLLFLGSSCIYPKFAPQPIQENALLTGSLEPTNEPYAIAKIAGIKLCESYNRQYGTDYRSLMPTNLYGPGDNYHPENSHVVPALLRRIHEAKLNNHPSVTIWGTGNARREFLHVDDLASAACFVMQAPKENYWSRVSPMQSHVNVGFGNDVSIAELAPLIKQTVSYEGVLEFDVSKPDGTPKKLMDSRLLNEMGWTASIPLMVGLADAYRNFLDRDILIGGH
jgi:GDP-L-fucose synthase